MTVNVFCYLIIVASYTAVGIVTTTILSQFPNYYDSNKSYQKKKKCYDSLKTWIALKYYEILVLTIGLD